LHARADDLGGALRAGDQLKLLSLRAPFIRTGSAVFAQERPSSSAGP
jgi:hypothetical protein